MSPPWPWLRLPLEMCACDTKQAQGFPAHHNKAQPLDRAMTAQSSSTTTPGPAMPRDRVLLRTIHSPHQGNHSQPQPRVPLLGLSPPQSPPGGYKSFPLTGGSEKVVLQFGTPHPRCGEGHSQGCPPSAHFGGTLNSCECRSSICGT